MSDTLSSDHEHYWLANGTKPGREPDMHRLTAASGMNGTAIGRIECRQVRLLADAQHATPSHFW